MWMDVLSCTDLSCYETWITRYNVDGDTLIGPHQYAKLHARQEYEQGSDQSQWCWESIQIFDFHFGDIREDGKKVFLKRPSEIEYLAYDFNLDIGDTVPCPGNSTAPDSLRIIDSIDSVIVNGVYRKRYVIFDGVNIIEGIGASTGLFNPLFPSFGICYRAMECHTENNIPQYYDNNCNMNLDVETILPIDSQPELIKIVDLTGKEIEETTNILMIYVYSDGTSKKIFRVGQ